jgi:hypothetical protein
VACVTQPAARIGVALFRIDRRQARPSDRILELVRVRPTCLEFAQLQTAPSSSSRTDLGAAANYY